MGLLGGVRQPQRPRAWIFVYFYIGFLPALPDAWAGAKKSLARDRYVGRWRDVGANEPLLGSILTLTAELRFYSTQSRISDRQ